MTIKRLIKMMSYNPVKIIINTLRLAKVIINVVVLYHNFPTSIISNRGAIIISKFWFLFYYFIGIKKQLLSYFTFR